jgi:hypothetical protein
MQLVRLSVLAFVVVVFALAVSVWTRLDRPAPPRDTELLNETMNFNAVSSPELAKKSEAIFQRAYAAMEHRLSAGRMWRQSGDWLDGAGLLLGAFLTILGGWFGKPIAAAEGLAGNAEQLGRITARSKWHIRVLACGLATVVALHSLSDRCESLSLKSIARGTTLAERIRQSRVEFDKAGDDAEREAALIALDRETLD